MDILLILNNSAAKNVRIMVKLTEKNLKERIISLLEKDCGEEAFDVIVKNAEPYAYVPPDVKVPRKSVLITLDEQLIKSKSPIGSRADFSQDSVCQFCFKE
ncbi:MAG: hypothetical protein KAJ18_09310 [Candidatus Omnitrophica bacterium]|nr:hypothetical protein [Candidatus Omnitrophota bacterium]